MPCALEHSPCGCTAVQVQLGCCQRDDARARRVVVLLAMALLRQQARCLLHRRADKYGGKSCAVDCR
jgi:hypothetical protein